MPRQDVAVRYKVKPGIVLAINIIQRIYEPFIRKQFYYSSYFRTIFGRYLGFEQVDYQIPFGITF